MKYAGFIENDCVNGQGVSITLFMQGCPFHCKGCHNPETWDFEGGKDIDIDDLIQHMIESVSRNGITRNINIMGGEPLCEQNKADTATILYWMKAKCPNSKIIIWTGYTLEELRAKQDEDYEKILSSIDILVDGPFILEQRDITLPLRGSTNQRILYKGRDF